jgi:hypothetical protein
MNELLVKSADQENHICTVETACSEINNGGFEAQIEYLLAAGVSAEVMRRAVQR